MNTRVELLEEITALNEQVDRLCGEKDALEKRNAELQAALENMGRDCKACGRWHMTGCDHYFACEGPDVCDPRCLIAQAAIEAAGGSSMAVKCPVCQHKSVVDGRCGCRGLTAGCDCAYHAQSAITAAKGE